MFVVGEDGQIEVRIGLCWLCAGGRRQLSPALPASGCIQRAADDMQCDSSPGFSG